MNGLMFSKVDDKGRVMIPGELRAKHGIAPGDHVHVEIDGRKMRLCKVNTCPVETES